jgi:hypothetical protein
LLRHCSFFHYFTLSPWFLNNGTFEWPKTLTFPKALSHPFPDTYNFLPIDCKTFAYLRSHNPSQYDTVISNTWSDSSSSRA